MTMPTFTDGVVVHQAALNSLSTGINNLSTYMLGATPPRSYVPAVRLRQAISQTFTNNTQTLVTWDTADLNNDNMWVSSTNTTITVQTAGSYVALAQLVFAANATGERFCYILQNGTNPAVNSQAEDHQIGLNLGDGNFLHCYAMHASLAVGATIYVDGLQSSGGNLGTVVNSVASSRFYMWRIGP